MLVLVVNLVVEFGEEVFVNVLFYVAHLEFFFGILADLGNPGAAGSDVVLTNALTGGLVEFFELVVVHDHLVASCPAIIAVVVVNLNKTVEYIVDIVDVAILDILNQALLLALGQ